MRFSGSYTRNPDVVDLSRECRNRDNVEFFARALRTLAEQGYGNGGLMVIALLGQRDIPGITLRRAQAVLRWDQRPSLWSHALLIAAALEPTPAAVAKAPILEVSLYPRTGVFPRPEQNGVSEGTLGQYRAPKLDANAALLAVKMSDEEAQRVAACARNYNVDRLRYDLWDTLGIWQAYLWAHGQRPNPLRERVPIFSSSYVEMAFEALPLDLTPAASERNSAPELIWNAALWWQESYAAQGRAIRGCYVLRDPAAALLSADD